jgi:ferredoxin-NADP reductase
MAEYIVRILNVEPVTHDVRRFQIEKPEGYSFVPGQATDLSINSEDPKMKRRKRSFTFTCLNSDPYLEFTIKIYPQHMGVTNELGKLQAGDELIIRDPWGAIAYKGKGAFIAGGAGVTPFIAILRDLKSRNEIDGNMLLFANKTREDIIMKPEFEEMLGKNFVNILSDEKTDEYEFGFLNPGVIKKYADLDQKFYVCGPPPMMIAVLAHLDSLGVKAESIITETF